MLTSVHDYIAWLSKQSSCIGSYSYPAQAAKYGTGGGVSPVCSLYTESRNVVPYSHQLDMALAVKDGYNVIITTPTASGKTLGFELAIIELLARIKTSTVLALYPAKAVAHDQYERYKTFGTHGSQLFNSDISVGVLDGDSGSYRNKIKQSRIIISNPHSLHCWLAGTSTWSEWLANCNLLILDESHMYSGVLGGHIALLLRRFIRLRSLYTSVPLTIVAASATIGNPLAHIEALTGIDSKTFIHINKSGAPTGPYHLVVLDNTIDRNIKYRSVSTGIKAGLNTLCFVKTRQGAENTSRELGRLHDVELPCYRAGYSHDQRLGLERQLRDGSLMGLVSTSALELGIDIGNLKVVNIMELPATISGLHQQLGRVGRTSELSVKIVQLDGSQLSRYFASDPQQLLTRMPENAIADTTNPTLLVQHLTCAAFESPLVLQDRKYFDKTNFNRSVNWLTEQNRIVLKKVGEEVQYHSADKSNPALTISLLGKARDDWQVFDDETHRLLETVDDSYRIKELFLGASWLKAGSTYQVMRYNTDERIIYVRSAPHYFAQAKSFMQIRLGTVHTREVHPRWVLCYGPGQYINTILGYKSNNSHGVKGFKAMESHLYSSPLSYRVRTDVFAVTFKTATTVAGVESFVNLLIHLLPLRICATSNDVIFTSTSGSFTIADSAQGGSGIVHGLYSTFFDLVDDVRTVIKRCGCNTGCPNCVLSNNVRTVSKREALQICNLLLDHN